MAERTRESNQDRVVDLEAGAHVMHLDRGLFCIFHAPGQPLPGPSGLPGVRISRAPSTSAEAVEISTFECDGWIGGAYGAALVRVKHHTAGVLVTTYRDPSAKAPGPRLQVMRLASGPAETGLEEAGIRSASDQSGRAAARATKEEKDVSSQNKAQSVEESGDMGQDIQAHVQNKGDCGVHLGQWIGEPGSQAWIEGFAINPVEGLGAEDIEYQAVLGKGWLSPWVEGGHFCGSRGMSLPILGLRIRLRGEAAQRYRLSVSASFTDGTRLGPVEGDMGEALEAETLAPLEAFRLEIEKLTSSSLEEASPDEAEKQEEGKKIDRRKAKRSSRRT